METKKFTYIVVFQNSNNERIARVYAGTFDQVVKMAKLACRNSGYFILEIKIA